MKGVRFRTPSYEESPGGTGRYGKEIFTKPAPSVLRGYRSHVKLASRIQSSQGVCKTQEPPIVAESTDLGSKTPGDAAGTKQNPQRKCFAGKGARASPNAHPRRKGSRQEETIACRMKCPVEGAEKRKGEKG